MYRSQITRPPRRVADIAEDLEEQVIEKVRNQRFSIQIHEATDSSVIGQLIVYVRYVETTTINEDMPFCKFVKRRATEE
jgi:hypothetical protein